MHFRVQPLRCRSTWPRVEGHRGSSGISRSCDQRGEKRLGTGLAPQCAGRPGELNSRPVTMRMSQLGGIHISSTARSTLVTLGILHNDSTKSLFLHMLVFQGDGDAMVPALASAAQPFRETARQPPPARTPSPRLANGPSILKADSCIALGLLFPRHLLHRPTSLRSLRSLAPLIVALSLVFTTLSTRSPAPPHDPAKTTSAASPAPSRYLSLEHSAAARCDRHLQL